MRFISACCIHTVHCHPVLLRFVLILFSHIATSYRRGFSLYTFRLKPFTHLSPPCVLHARCLPLLNLTSVIDPYSSWVYISQKRSWWYLLAWVCVFLVHCRLLALISVLEYWWFSFLVLSYPNVDSHNRSECPDVRRDGGGAVYFGRRSLELRWPLCDQLQRTAQIYM
jgi:hypothetical protein